MEPPLSSWADLLPVAEPRPRGRTPLWTAAGALILLVIGGVALRPLWGLAIAALLGLLLALLALRPPVTSGLVLWGCVLLTPDVPLHASLGLVVQWSRGLTFSNFLIPALTLPLMAWAWLRGGRLAPSPLPRCIVCFLLFLAWAAISWLPWLVDQGMGAGVSAIGFLSLLAHWSKLVLIVLLAAFVVEDVRGRLPGIIPWFLAGMGLNGLLALLQLVHLLPVFSPLAGIDSTVRVTGAFYDANIYASLVAMALILTMACLSEARLTRLSRWSLLALALLLAANLVFAVSRAGYLTLLVGMAVLAGQRRWKPVACLAAGCLVLTMLFPLRTWGRIQNTVEVGLASVGWPIHSLPDAATAARVTSMHDSLFQYARHPWLGLGFGRALYLGVPTRGGLDYPGQRRLDAQADRSFTGAQNMFLTILAETGPMGLIFYLGWLASLFLALRQRPSASAGASDGLEPALAAGLTAGLAGLVAAGCTLEIFLNARVLAIVLVLVGAWESRCATSGLRSTRI